MPGLPTPFNKLQVRQSMAIAIPGAENLIDGKVPDPNKIREVKSAVSTPQEQLEAYRNIDMVSIPIILLLFGGITVFLSAVTVGDWDYWMDWRDRRWWPLVIPALYIIFPTVIGTFTWNKLRLPIGATASMLSFVIGMWLSRVFNFYSFADFPLNFVSPSTLIMLGVILDAMLVWTKSFYITGFLGAFLFGLLPYAANWPVFALWHVPVDYHGTLVTVADLTGYQYVRTAIPEYVRIIEESTLRTFGEAVTPLTAFFAGFVCIINYYLWVLIGSYLSESRWSSRIW
ncbi:MAG: methane monooxygenase/ammonia monooxygenase subunit A [Pseudomonadales bacterium]|nr:methane monooxygenase/ammonia monooxygenase subunit A [Pseudomonadales bacterium]